MAAALQTVMRKCTVAALVLFTLTATPLLAAEPADDAVLPTAVTVARPLALPPLYASFAALQVYDGYSTMAGLKRGAGEANPMMQSIVGSPAKFWATKAVTTAAAVVIAERMWKTNKVGAIVTMAIANGVSAAIAARNASVLKQVR
jgi:hypothetical protein